MGQRIENQTKPQRTLGVDGEVWDFYLVGAGAAAPTFGGGIPGNMVGTIARTSAGKYTVPMNAPVYKVITHKVTVDDTSTPDFSTGTIGPISNENTTTGLSFQLNIATSGSAADMAAGRKIRITLKVQRTQWGVMT